MNLDGGIWRYSKLTLARILPPSSFKKVFLYVEYVIILENRKVNGKEKKHQRRVLEKVYIKSLSLFKTN